jgi:hypothetical protein
MATLKTIIFIILFGAIWSFVHVIISNIAGLPGALIAGKTIFRSNIRFKIGAFICTLGQTYGFFIKVNG